MRILVVEDDLLLAYGIEEILAEADHSVAGIATRARDAYTIVSGVPPELALVDIRLAEEESGITVAQKLFCHFGVHTLFTTGNADQCDPGVLQTFALGCLHKPFGEQDLLAAIDVAEQVMSGLNPVQIPAALDVYQ